MGPAIYQNALTRISLVFSVAVLCTFCSSTANATTFEEIQIRSGITPQTFYMLDCISGWDDDCRQKDAFTTFINGEAPNFLKSNETFLEKYRLIRGRHVRSFSSFSTSPTSSRNGLFAWIEQLDSDPIADLFYSSPSEEAAIESLSKFLDPEEIKLLKLLFKNTLSALPTLNNQLARTAIESERLNKEVQGSGIKQHLQIMETFLGVKQTSPYNVILIWSPSNRFSSAFPIGNNLILIPAQQKEENAHKTATILHEIQHTLSARLDFTKKQKLTQSFTEKCDLKLKNISILKTFEEPLAVAIGQMLYLKTQRPLIYKKTTHWYADSWVETFAKSLLPLVERYKTTGRPLDASFMETAGRECFRLEKIMPNLHEELGIPIVPASTQR